MAGIKSGGGKSLQKIIDRHQAHPGAMLGILEDVQASDPHRYLRDEALRAVADATGTPLSSVYSTATFYSYFNLKPQGDHVIVVCRGTACHTRGSLGLLEEAAAMLGFEDFQEGDDDSFTTEDARFTIRTVACFGQCALAPVIAIDGKIYSRMSANSLARVIGSLQKAGKK